MHRLINSDTSLTFLFTLVYCHSCWYRKMNKESDKMLTVILKSTQYRH